MDYFGAAKKLVGPGRRARGAARRRRALFERLEDRIVLTAALHSGPSLDTLVVSPAEAVDEYEVSLGPRSAASGNAEAAPTVIDLATITPADQRYMVPDAGVGPLFRIDPRESYTLEAAGSPRISDLSSPDVFGYRSFDADRLEIEPLHVTKHAFATDTTLAAPLSPGDASLLVADTSGWSNDTTASAETRSLAWYGYTNSAGFTYSDYTYTRNVAFDFDDGLWAAGEIWFDASVGAYRIPLNAPWEGPAIAAGTAIRNATSGPALSEPFPESLVNLPERWQTQAVTIAGEWVDGQRDDLAFRPGTAFVQPSTIVNGSIWNSIVFGPTVDFASATSTPITTSATNEFSLELDVLAKDVTSFASDYNGDGRVDAVDYAVWRESLSGDGVLPFTGGDANGDAVVNSDDLNVWRAAYGAEVEVTLESAAATYGAATITPGPHGPVIHYESPPWFVGTDVVTYTLRDAATGATLESHVLV